LDHELKYNGPKAISRFKERWNATETDYSCYCESEEDAYDDESMMLRVAFGLMSSKERVISLAHLEG